MNDKIRVAIVDEHPLYRDGIVYTLEGVSDFEVVGLGETAQDALKIAKKHQVDLFILSLSVAGGGLNALQDIMLQWPNTQVLTLAPFADDEQACAALKYGARGYAHKEIAGAELVKIIHMLARGESYVSPNLAAKLLSRLGNGNRNPQKEQDRFYDLSPREEQILSRLMQGLSNKEIAIKLDLSEKTIKHHVTNILQKLQVRNRVEAAILASGRSARSLAASL